MGLIFARDSVDFFVPERLRRGATVRHITIAICALSSALYLGLPLRSLAAVPSSTTGNITGVVTASGGTPLSGVA